jgi:hypothetical protein
LDDLLRDIGLDVLVDLLVMVADLHTLPARHLQPGTGLTRTVFAGHLSRHPLYHRAEV